MNTTAEPPAAPSNALNDAFSEMDSMVAGNPNPEPAKAPEPAPKPDPASDPEPAKEPVNTAEPAPAPKQALEKDEFGLPKRTEPKKVEAPKAPTPEPKGPKELREAYAAAKARADAADALEAEVKALKEQLAAAPKINPDDVVGPWKEKLTAAEKRAAELDEKVRFSNYVESAEYRTKFHDPLVKAQKLAMEDIQGVTVNLPDGETRAATIEDLLTLQRLPAAQAAKIAAQAFAEAAPVVMQHVARIRDLNRGAQEAIQEWKEKGSQFRAESERQQQEINTRSVQQFEETLKSISSGRPDLFDADPETPEAKDLMDQGNKLVRMALFGEGIQNGITPEESRGMVIKAQASMAARARSFGPVVAKLMKAQDEVAELRAKVAKYEASDPKPKPPGTAENKHAGEVNTVDDALAQLG